MFNFFEECKGLRLSLWQCPPFLFIIMGIINIGAMVGTYVIATRYFLDEAGVVIIVVIVSTVIFIIGHSIIAGFNQMAQANRMKNEFVSVISHQLRTPLAAFKWSTELLLKPSRVTTLDENDKSYLGILKDNTERMIKLVNLLIEVNRIESSHLILGKKPIDLVDLTNNVLDNLQAYADAYNLTLKFETPPNPPQAIGDPDKVKMVILTLLDNAIRYSHRKSEIVIKLLPMRNTIKWQITDTGVGIPKDQSKYIFQKFFRSANARKYQTEGSGLGLYIAKAIIEELGGSIAFTSVENKGSTFMFSLPLSS